MIIPKFRQIRSRTSNHHSTNAFLKCDQIFLPDHHLPESLAAMRRSASPSKAARSGGGNSTPSRPLHRTGSDDSANVLKAAFKPLSGLGSRRQSSLPPEDSSASSAAADPTPIPNPSLTPTREASRAKSVPELEAEVAAMEESLA